MALVLTVAPKRIVLGSGAGGRAEVLRATRERLLHHLAGYIDRFSNAKMIARLLAPAGLKHLVLIGAMFLASQVAENTYSWLPRS